MTLNKNIEFCPCGLPKGHKQKCLASKFNDIREKIGRYSGKSKTPYGGYEDR